MAVPLPPVDSFPDRIFLFSKQDYQSTFLSSLPHCPQVRTTLLCIYWERVKTRSYYKNCTEQNNSHQGNTILPVKHKYSCMSCNSLTTYCSRSDRILLNFQALILHDSIYLSELIQSVKQWLFNKLPSHSYQGILLKCTSNYLSRIPTSSSSEDLIRIQLLHMFHWSIISRIKSGFPFFTQWPLLSASRTINIHTISSQAALLQHWNLQMVQAFSSVKLNAWTSNVFWIIAI